ncbi:MAG: hypothetical protein V1743_03090 [Nanoarchaeota archaeon]
MTSDLKIRDVTLEGVLTGPKNTSAEDLKKINALINEIQAHENGSIASEQMPLNLLQAEKAARIYPELDPSFLSMQQPAKYEGKDICLPRFSVHCVYETTRFNILFNYQEFGNMDVQFSAFYLPDCIFEQYIKGMEFFPKSTNPRIHRCGDHGYINETPGKISKKYNHLLLRTEFHGVIPQETRERLQEAQATFSKNRLFFIKETKPEEWSVQRVTIDPLAVGVIDGKCYLIDKFNTTPFEEYVGVEWKKQ